MKNSITRDLIDSRSIINYFYSECWLYSLPVYCWQRGFLWLSCLLGPEMYLSLFRPCFKIITKWGFIIIALMNVETDPQWHSIILLFAAKIQAVCDLKCLWCICHTWLNQWWLWSWSKSHPIQPQVIDPLNI